MATRTYSYALSFVTLMRSIAGEQIEKLRPAYKLAEVRNINRLTNKCLVRYAGETVDQWVSMGSVQPTKIGQIVRVDGLLGDRFVSDVIPTLDAPAFPGAKGTPSYVGLRTKPFDPVDGIYNLTTSSAAWWQDKIKGTAYGSRLSTLNIFGSSTVAGAETPGLSSFPYRLRDILESKGVVVKGTGPSYPQPGIGSEDPRWTKSASGVTTAVYFLYVNIANSAWVQFNSDRTGTTVDIHYGNSGGSFTYSIDGGAAVAVNPTGASTSAKVTISGLSNTTHTVRITGTSATATILNAIDVYPGGNGLRLSAAGSSGTATADFINGGYLTNQELMRVATATVNIICVGANDYTGGIPVSTFKNNMTQLVNLNTFWNGGSVIVVMPHATSSSLEGWQPYVSAMYDVADDRDVPLVDMTYRWGDQSRAVSGNLLTGLGVHPSAAGHADYARVLARVLGF